MKLEIQETGKQKKLKDIFESGYKKSVNKQGWRIEKSPHYNPAKEDTFVLL